MRPDLSGPQETLLATGLHQDHWLLTVANGDGTPVDLSDRIVQGNWKQSSPSNPIATFSISLVREFYDPLASLAPLVGASLLNRLDDEETYSALLQSGRDVVLKCAVVAKGAARPADEDFIEVLRGKIDRVSWPEEWGNVTIEGRDQAGVLMDTWTENTAVYPAGSDLEEMMQDILDAEFGAAVYTIEVPVATSYVTADDFEPDASVWDTLTALANKLGWVLWYRYNADGEPELTLFEPDRDVTDPDFTHVLARAITRLDIDVADIRNVVVGFSYDEGGVEITDSVEDATSIAKYGGVRRFMRLVEPVGSVIREEAQLTAMITAALSDLKDPDAEMTITVPFFWPGEVSVDLYTFPALEQFYDDPQNFAPSTIEHVFNGGGLTPADTILSVRGKPTASAKVWVGRESRNRQNTTDATANRAVTATKPSVHIVPLVDQVSGTASATVVGSFGVQSVKIVASTAGFPSRATAQAATALNGTVVHASTIGSLLTSLTSAHTVYFSALGYAEADGAGEETPVLAQAQVRVGTGSSSLVDAAVIAAKLADDAVTRAKILNAAIDDTKLASASVTNAKLALLAVDTGNIVNAAVAEAKLATSAVTETKIANDSVATAKLIALNVTSAKIAAGAIISGKISVGAIDATNLIASGIITNTLIATGTITADRIVSATITATQMAANSITASQISTDAVTADKILASAVTAVKIATDAVTANKIEAGAVTAAKISVSSLSAISANIGSITAGSISGVTGTFAGDLSASTCTASGSFQIKDGASDWVIRMRKVSDTGSIDIRKSDNSKVAIIQLNGTTGELVISSSHGEISLACVGNLRLLPSGSVYLGASDVSAGANDTGGSGFKVLRVPN